MAQRISIVGLGLIGTSLGLALKKAGVEADIVGYDKNKGNAAHAQRQGGVDRVARNLPNAVDEAALTILAVPLGAMRQVMEEMGKHLPDNGIVTDTGSTKEQVLRWAEEVLPNGVSFVGGHPMAGKEASGPKAAEATLFAGCVYCIIPSLNATQAAVQTVVGLVDLVGARPFFMDATEHDSWVAGVSHLPLILSAVLVSVTTGDRAWREMSKLAASGYRDVTRLASGDPEMGRDICLTNRDSLLRWIDSYLEELGEYRRLVSEGGDGLLTRLTGARGARERWLYQRELPETPRVEVASFRQTISEMFLGQLTRRGEEILKRLEGKAKEGPP
ncbi:MAG: prephenate dehydrogenase/arogenate dehydrogenase family protein [Chloroflexi bacterium]|nr:prephenate dehydrogenase/arogenate dehydrogenase family protein [Chloroflexota bacterium]